MDICIGDILRLTHFETHYPKPPEGARFHLERAGFKAPKGKVYVAVLLAVEDKDGKEPANLELVMEKLGWTRKNQQPPKADAKQSSARSSKKQTNSKRSGSKETSAVTQ